MDSFKMPKMMSILQYLDNQQTHGQSSGHFKLISNRLGYSNAFHTKDLFSHFGCVNAVEFSDDGEWLVSGGDDKRVLIWNMEKTLSGSNSPSIMKGEHQSNIFCLGFNKPHDRIFSAGNDEQVIMHDATTGETLDVFLHTEAVYGLSVDPSNGKVFASACDDGRILIWDTRSTTSFDPLALADCSSAFHAVMYNPMDPRFLATAHSKHGVCLWDIRKPKSHLMQYGPPSMTYSAMSVRFNAVGSQILALRRRYPPMLFELSSTYPCAEFDHPEYYNSCTMKSCCFAGDRDQYILSGSDDFKLYCWKIPDNVSRSEKNSVSKAHSIFRGHRSIVNQVRYNGTYGIIASSGVEKIIKFWSSFPLTNQEKQSEYVSSTDSLRRVYTHEEYINLVLESGHHVNHDYSHESVQEDPRMMAFFDSLVQRDIEGWTTDSSTEDTTNYTRFVQSSCSSSSSSSSSSDDDDNSATARLDRLIKSSYVPRPAITRCVFHNPYEVETARTNPGVSRRQKKAEKHQKSTTDSTETSQSLDPSLDRISILIAKKRKERVMLKSETHYQPRTKTFQRNYGPVSATMEDVLDLAGPSGEQETIGRKRPYSSKDDKRKLLNKKRARYNRDPSLDDKSSDSSEDEPESSVRNNIHDNTALGSSSVVGNAEFDNLSINCDGDKKSSKVYNKKDVIVENNFEANNASSSPDNKVVDAKKSNDNDDIDTQCSSSQNGKEVHDKTSCDKKSASESPVSVAERNGNASSNGTHENSSTTNTISEIQNSASVKNGESSKTVTKVISFCGRSINRNRIYRKKHDDDDN